MFIILIKLVLISHKNKINGRVRNLILCTILQTFNILFIKFLLKYNTWRTEWVRGVSGHCSCSAPAQYFRFPSWSLLGSQTSTFLGIPLNSQKWEVTFPPERACVWGNRQIRHLPLKQSCFGLLLSPKTETVLAGRKARNEAPKRLWEAQRQTYYPGEFLEGRLVLSFT